jgi:pyruvate dehydrogenase E1 component
LRVKLRKNRLLYLHSAVSSAQLCALSAETAQRGILCNDIETQPSAWPKGAQPSLPLWAGEQSALHTLRSCHG